MHEHLKRTARIALPLYAVSMVAMLVLCCVPASAAPTTVHHDSATLTGTGADSQAGRYVANAPTSQPTSTAARPGRPTRALIGYVLIGLVVVGWLVVFVVRARRRRAPRPAPVPFMAPTDHAAIPRSMSVPQGVERPRDVGWHSDPDHMSEQAYWDGRSWTARRRWNGESWVDVSQGPPS